MTFVIEKCDYSRSSELVAWFGSRDEADRYCLEHGPKSHYDDWLVVSELVSDGKIEHVATFDYEPELYRGGLVRARIRWGTCGENGMYHRTPIDCLRPNPDRTLYESDPWRVLSTEHCGEDRYGDHGGEYFQCHCGGWQDIEGSPAKVAELVEDHPA